MQKRSEVEKHLVLSIKRVVQNYFEKIEDFEKIEHAFFLMGKPRDEYLEEYGVQIMALETDFENDILSAVRSHLSIANYKSDLIEVFVSEIEE